MCVNLPAGSVSLRQRERRAFDRQNKLAVPLEAAISRAPLQWPSLGNSLLGVSRLLPMGQQWFINQQGRFAVNLFEVGLKKSDQP